MSLYLKAVLEVVLKLLMVLAGWVYMLETLVWARNVAVRAMADAAWLSIFYCSHLEISHELNTGPFLQAHIDKTSNLHYYLHHRLAVVQTWIYLVVMAGTLAEILGYSRSHLRSFHR